MTAPTHALAALAIGAAFPRKVVPARYLCIGAVGAMLPDVDVVGFRFGIRYEDLWGHRGMTHSLFFAAVVSLLLLAILPNPGLTSAQRALRWLYLFLAIASHGILDAFTDGGLGIAFLAPFNNARYFFPVRPIVVSPIGISRFLSARSLPVLESELCWVWLPLLLLAGVFLVLGRRSPRTPRSAP